MEKGQICYLASSLPYFSDYSHGFRPGRGCHTALTKIYHTWVGTKWFIEADIAQCFDSLSKEVLLGILSDKIKDNRFLRLIENLLKAGYLENWQHKTSLSGVPQGSIVGPLLSNLYLDRLDNWVETQLLPLYNRGERRSYNPPYLKLMSQSRYWKKKGQKKLGLRLRRQAQNLPSLDPEDANYRRLRFLRYADDLLLGFVGPKQEAVEIKARLGQFLQSLKLELSEAKTLLTHAQTGAAKFLGYEIVILNNNHKHDWRDHRSINGQVGLKVPKEVIRAKQQLYLQQGKPKRRGGLSYNTPFTIITQYQQEFRGLVQYYQLAYNLHQFNRLKWQMERSLVLTLADKFKLTMSKVYRRYETVVQTEHGPRKVLQVKVVRGEGKPPLVAQWGGLSLARNVKAVLDEQPHLDLNDRSELIQRLLADKCELCGSKEDVEIHHIRGLKDLKRRGQAPRPQWVEVMAARQRKTLVVCRKCHDEIHHGQRSKHLQLA
jgi:hypothetical protein